MTFDHDPSKKTHHPLVVLLVDDQVIVAEAIRRMLEDEKDIILHYCGDPEKALSAAAEVSPTVILQDLVMPDMDGLSLVKHYRANPATKDIPLIVLSVEEDPKIKAKAFALGVNDYMVKLPDKVELIARLRYHSAAYIRLLERNNAYEQLEKSQRHLHAELNEAAQYVRSLLPEPICDHITVDWRYIPSSLLGGDAFDYLWIDDENFVVYVLDVCGHGIGAALLSITILHTLRSPNIKIDYLDPAKVLAALNQEFPMEKYNNMFFTMWYGVYNKTARTLRYSTAGHPPAILFAGSDAQTLKKFKLKTEGLAIGVEPSASYANEVIKLEAFNKLYIFSDGIYEIFKDDNLTLSLEEFVAIIESQNQKNEDDLDNILRSVRSINKAEAFTDDVSILEVIM